MLREIRDLEGITVCWKSLNDLRYVDDNFLRFTTESNLQRIIEKVAQDSAEKASLWTAKRQDVCVVMSKKEVLPPFNLRIGTKSQSKYIVLTILAAR